MSIKIGIANYAGFFQFIERIRPELPQDVEFVILNDLFGELERSVKRIERSGSVDIFVASGGNAQYLEKYLQNIPLVKVQITGFDILNAVKSASAFSDDIAVVTMNELPYFDDVKNLLKANLRHVRYSSPEDLAMILQALYAEGIRDVIGTALVLEQAKMFNMRGHFIWSLDSVRTAINTAIAIVRSKKAIAEKAKMLDYLMDYAAEGIIITDANGIITHFNNSAERILNRSRKKIIGRQCAEVLPNTQLHTVMREKRAQYNRIQDLGNVKIVTNRSPIICENEVIGSLATFFSTSTIKQAGENIRRSQNLSCYIAQASFDDFRTSSANMANAIKLAERYARSRSAILIQGESGTGKETMAQRMHNASARKNEPFLAVNCAAILPELLETELFGIDEPCSAGKRNGRTGLIELANEGTLFLSSVDRLPLTLQAKLLKLLEIEQLFRVNSETGIPIDIRVIAACEKDLKQLVNCGHFSRELYYRLSVLALRLPALRERKDDLPLLIRQFLSQNRQDLDQKELDAICSTRHFYNYNWPGNLRELQTVIERFCVLYVPGTDVKKAVEEALEYDGAPGLESHLSEEQEREEIEAALAEAAGNRAAAAELLGISRTTLWRRMRELKIVCE